MGNRKTARFGGDDSGANLRSIGYTANAVNQYSAITHPGIAQLLGFSPNAGAITATPGQLGTTKTQGNFWRAEISANTSSGIWANVQATQVVSGSPQTIGQGKLWIPPATENPLYDDDGNLKQDGRWIYTWNAENRLVEMTPTASALTGGHPWMRLRFQYDFMGRRIHKKVETGSSASPVVTVNRLFLYDGWNLIAEMDTTSGTAKTRATYLWGLDLSGSSQGAGGVGGLLMASLITNNSITNHYFPTYDGNGNIIAWINGSGNVAQRYDYDPFGRVLTRQGNVDGLTFGFSTKYTDSETGLCYYGYRYYDPVHGRWQSRDPIGEGGGLNLFGFVGNEPIWHIDILGLKGKKSCPFNVEGGHVGEISDPREDKNNDGEPDEQDDCSSGRYYGASCYRTGRGSGYAWANELSKRLSMEGKLFTGPTDPATGKPSESPYNNKAKKEDPTIRQLLIEKIKQAEADAKKDCTNAEKCCMSIELKVKCHDGNEMKIGRRTDSELEKACNYKNTYKCANARWSRLTYTKE